MAISCHMPVGFPAIAYRPRLPLWYAQLNETLCSLPGLLPLFPDIASEPSAQPFVPPLHRCLHTCNPEVTKPAPDVDLYLLHHESDISALTAGSQLFQLCLGFLQGLCMSPDVYFPSAKPRNLKFRIENTLTTLLFSMFILSFNFPSRYRWVLSRSRSAARLLFDRTTISSA